MTKLLADASPVECDVLIVGGGPCGLAAAIALGRCGVRTVLVERHPSTSFHPRGHVVNARTMEILRARGAWRRPCARAASRMTATRASHSYARWREK